MANTSQPNLSNTRTTTTITLHDHEKSAQETPPEQFIRTTINPIQSIYVFAKDHSFNRASFLTHITNTKELVKAIQRISQALEQVLTRLPVDKSVRLGGA